MRYPRVGDRVKVIQKKNYESGILTEGVVKEVLTKKSFHSRGHKVRLEGGVVGRVQEYLDTKPDEELDDYLDEEETII